MADIFEEVEEGLRQDRFGQLWKKYGILAYLGAALIIGGVALNEYLQTTRQATLVQNAETLESALAAIEQGDSEQAASILDGLANSDVSLAPIAAHYLAAIRMEQSGDPLSAADVLNAAANQYDGPAGKLALLKAAYLEADTLSRGELESKLAPLREDDSAFSAMAIELIAAKALQDGDIEFARKEFTYLQIAPNVPTGTAQRAARALAALPPPNLDDLNTLDVEPAEGTGEAPTDEETGE